MILDKRSGPIELSIVVPTYNESENVPELIERLELVLGKTGWEVIFVDDDSADQTAQVVRDIGKHDLRVRCLQRIGRRGLASACIEGMLAASGDLIAVMDADLQHDERILPEMCGRFTRGPVDVVVATRYGQGGTTGDWDQSRRQISRFATSIGRLFIGGNVSDPMSGFFMVRRRLVSAIAPRLSGIGFKILLDILITARTMNLVVEEVPYTFRSRTKGQSKLDQQVVWEFGMLLADKLVGRLIPVHFISFSLIGSLGILVHLLILVVLLKGFGVPFVAAHSSATLIAMIFNYSLNNEITYRDRRLRSWRWLKGLVIFIICCAIGMFANVGVATYLFHAHTRWVNAALAGIMIGAVWNYAATRFYAWNK